MACGAPLCRQAKGDPKPCSVAASLASSGGRESLQGNVSTARS